MKELSVCGFFGVMLALSLVLMELEDQTKLTKEQNEILIIYCKAMPECKKEMEK